MRIVADIKSLYKRGREFALRHKRHLPTAALAAGFVWDFITLGRPDQLFDNAVLLFYILLAGVIILLLSQRQGQTGEHAPLWQLIVLQFSFGNLASALFILFGKSGTIIGNWPFLLVLVALIVGNELTAGRSFRLRFHVAVYYLMLFAYFVLVIPVLFREVGVEMFLLSGLVSLIAIALYLATLYKLAPIRTAPIKQHMAGIIVAIFVGYNILYFANLIPPVPLALRDIGMYHALERDPGGDYLVSYAAPEWYEFWRRSDTTIHLGSTSGAFCFSSVFAPARINTLLYHHWEFFDKGRSRWESASRIAFPIAGGRDDGFRGFSTKSALFPGDWRCSIETERGVLLGRREFKVSAGAVSDGFNHGVR